MTLTTDAAADAAEALRALCHATISPDPDARVSDIYHAAAELSSVGHRLEQALQQLAGLLEHRHDVSALRSDDGSDPAAAIATAASTLRHAASKAADLGRDLSAAQQAIAMIADPGTAEPIRP